MERCKILEEFIDKHTGAKYLPGEHHEFSKERIKEILKAGKYIKVDPEKKSAK